MADASALPPDPVPLPKNPKVRPIDALYCAACGKFFSFRESYVTDPAAKLKDGTRAVFHSGCYKASSAVLKAAEAEVSSFPSRVMRPDGFRIYRLTELAKP